MVTETSQFDNSNRRNRIEVLSDRLVPGTDGRMDHVIIANDAITVVRSAEMRGRVRISGSDVYVGGANANLLLTGLHARIDHVRHLVGDSIPVQGALFLSRGRTTPTTAGSIIIGEDRQVIEMLKSNHCAVPDHLDLPRIAAELDGILLPQETFSLR